MQDHNPGRTGPPATAAHREPHDEAARLAELARYGVLSRPADPRFDRIVELAADVFEASFAAVSFLDREHQWIKASVGLPGIAQIPREGGFCTHTIAGDAVLAVRDATRDPRFRENPLVAGLPGIRFYAGAPLLTPGGHRLGTLSVADTRPRSALSPRARARLARLAALVMEAVPSPEFGMNGEDAAGFVGATQSAMLSTDSVGTITFVNQACERLLGYGSGALLGLNVRVIVPARLHGPHTAGMAAVVAGGTPKLAGKTVEVTAVRRDGSEVPIELALSSWRSGPAMGIGAVLRDISERRRRDTRLLRLAHQDAQTGLPNRVRLVDELATILSDGGTATVLALSIDGFRSVNDTFGYAVGDALLEALAVRLRARLDPAAMLARIGSDELAVLLPGQADPVVARTCAHALLSAFAEPIAVGDHVLHVGAGIGAALAPHDGADAEEVMASADLALHQARRDGARCFRPFEPTMRSAVAARRALQDALRLALEQGELELHYQPQVDLRTGAICGCEALIRWRHPERGLLPPGEFLPAIEASALALQVGWWTIDEACRQSAAWRAAGLPPIRMAVNLFSAQLRAGTLAAVVADALERHGLPAQALELEITEVIALQQDDVTMATLHALHGRGIGIAFDDFGTGYASLSTLKRFPLTKLKIDRSFVRDILTDRHDAAIVRAVLDIGHSFDLAVIAEGIETREQEASLLAMGCRIGQGFLYGRALEADILRQCLARAARTDGSAPRPRSQAFLARTA